MDAGCASATGRSACADRTSGLGCSSAALLRDACDDPPPLPRESSIPATSALLAQVERASSESAASPVTRRLERQSPAPRPPPPAGVAAAPPTVSCAMPIRGGGG